MPSCPRPSTTLRAAEAVARSRAILDRRCARRLVARAGRDERMVPIEQKDQAEESASKTPQNHPLDPAKRHKSKSTKRERACHSRQVTRPTAKYETISYFGPLRLPDSSARVI